MGWKGINPVRFARGRNRAQHRVFSFVTQGRPGFRRLPWAFVFLPVGVSNLTNDTTFFRCRYPTSAASRLAAIAVSSPRG